MSRLVDLGKKAINLEEVTGFSIDRKNYLFIPCFQEVSQLVASKSIFGKESHSVKTHYEFYHHIPYAVVLGEKEKPFPGDTYAYKTAGEIIGVDLVRKFTKVAGDAAHVAVRALNIDTSINRRLRLLVGGKEYRECRFDELPARLIYRDGRKVDVYKNSEIYQELGQDITPYEEPVPVLEVQMGKNKKYIFFGNGIDFDNVDVPYQALLTAYNLLHDTKENAKKLVASRIGLPKIDLGSIKIQSPFVIRKKEETTDNAITTKDQESE